MCNFKISKKEALSDTRSSVFDLHEKKLNYFDSEKSNLDNYITELNQLKEHLKKEYSNQTFNKIQILEDKIKSINNDHELNDYLLEFANLFYKNETNKKNQSNQEKGHLDSFVHSTVLNDKTELYNEYIKKFNPELKQINITKQEQLVCNNCQNNEFIYDRKNSDEVCTQCGTTSYIVGMEETNFVCIESSEQSGGIFNYKRNNHFQECLNQLQAKENTTIPPMIIEELTKEFRKYNITDPKLISYSLVKTHLRKLKYSNYYEHIPTIINEFCGIRAPVLTPEMEQQLKIMFDQIQGPFEKWCKIVSPHRKNFLNYNYVFYKMCQILHRTEFLIWFSLLKSREKLYEHDLIWKGICKELNWKFTPCI
jgi:hypothetical protein